MTRLLSWLLLVLLLAGFVAVAALVLEARAETGREMPAFSVYSRERDGLAATAQFLHDLGWKPVALTRPVGQLPPDPERPRLLFLVEPQPPALMMGENVALPKAEARAILRWVEDGNALVLCCRQLTGLHRELGVSMVVDLKPGRHDPVHPAVPGEAGAYTAGIDRMLVEGRDEVESAGGLPLWWRDDRPGAILLRRGRGRVFVVPDSSLLTRRGLVRADNPLWLYNLVRMHARDGRVYFDEFHHGLRAGGGFWGYLHHHRQHWALVPVLLVAAVAGWGAAVRLGPAVRRQEQSQADAVDYASALARIYQRAGVRHLMAEVLTRHFMTMLTRQLGLRRGAVPAEILVVWKRRRGSRAEDTGAERLAGLLRHSGELRRSVPSEKELLLGAREFDRFLKEHQLGAPGPPG